MEALIPLEKMCCKVGNHPGPVAPSITDGTVTT